ncbi:MAG: PhnD/SsuA/transferrin family substrate-binding protein [Phycisphaerales bacterium]|nr:PhnD/SsuA/transferrin family substrate-binding protein [Phycisphaerales bacterium]
MKRRIVIRCSGMVVAASAGCAAVGLILTGCAAPDFSTSFWNPLGLKSPFVLTREPIRVGVVRSASSNLDMLAWWDVVERTPWTEFQTALGWKTGRPVQIEQLKPFQLQAHLEDGWLDFAFLTDEQCAALMAETKSAAIIARAESDDRAGLIVASAKSDIQSLGQIAGQRFAFGPRGDPVLHYATVAALESAGVTIDGIQRELIPPDAFQYHISSFEAAKEVAFGATAVGVIEKSEYDQYADTGGRFFPLKYSKDQFRVLAEARPVKLGPVVASTSTDADLVDTVRGFLLSAKKRSPGVVSSLGIAGFTGAER